MKTMLNIFIIFATMINLILPTGYEKNEPKEEQIIESDLSLNNLEYGMFILSLCNIDYIESAFLNDFDDDNKLELYLKYNLPELESNESIEVILNEDKFVFLENKTKYTESNLEFIYSSLLNKILLKNTILLNNKEYTTYYKYSNNDWIIYAEVSRDKNKIINPQIDRKNITIDEWNMFENSIDNNYLSKLELDKILTIKLEGDTDNLIKETKNLIPINECTKLKMTKGDLNNNNTEDIIYHFSYDEYSVFPKNEKVPRESEYIQPKENGYILLVSPTNNGVELSLMDDNLSDFNIYYLTDIYISDGKLIYVETTDIELVIPEDRRIETKYNIIKNKLGYKELD